jgi:murein DD-endopeptidase MepM/ murein hydrolase activator NlpD
MTDRRASIPVLTTDLRDFSGALRWWRGCATLLGLCWSASSLGPPRPALHSAAAAREPAAQTRMIPPREVEMPSRPATSAPMLVGLKGQVSDDPVRAIGATGAHGEIAAAYAALLRRHRIALDHLAPDDEFRLVVETATSGAQRLVYAELLRRGQPPLRMLATGETPRLGVPVPARHVLTAYRLPVFGRITSAFGYRLHPILGYVRPHRGVDIGAPAGTPITVAAPGRVVSAGWSGGYGKRVRVRHADGLVSSYAHLSTISVAAGSAVAAGQTIGRVGWTGLATGPHLHFELTRNGVALDPTGRRLSTAVLVAAPSRALEQRYRRLRSWPMFQSISDAAARASPAS